MISKSKREVFIQVGYGLENKLKDEICRRIIDHKMVPHFREGNMYGGISSGLDSVIHILNQ